MTIQDFSELAGKLIEYSTELSEREFIASEKSDFETLLKIAKIKDNIDELLEVIDEEIK